MFYDRLFGPSKPPPFPDYAAMPKLKTFEEVKAYYDANWARIIFEKVRSKYGHYSPTYDEFVARLEYEPARNYVSPTKALEARAFEEWTQKSSISRGDYLDAVINRRHDVERIYKAFWDNPEGMEIARRITPRLPVKGTPLAQKHEQIVAILQQYLQPCVPPIKAWDVPQATVPQAECTFDETKWYTANLTGVRFMERWYLGSVILQFQNWWYGLKIRRFDIVDWETIDKIGDMYLVEGQRAETLPLAPKGRVLVTSPNDFNLAHEPVHAVQFSFVNFWEIPREHVEIPAMFVEKMVREDKLIPIDGKHLARQAALAIADLTTESPDDFNAEYEKLMGVTEAGHIRSRMPQLANCPQAYYGYVLGLTCDRKKQDKIAEAVRDPSKIMDLVGML